MTQTKALKDLTKQNLSSFPEEICNLWNLKILYLDQN